MPYYNISRPVEIRFSKGPPIHSAFDSDEIPDPPMISGRKEKKEENNAPNELSVTVTFPATLLSFFFRFLPGVPFRNADFRLVFPLIWGNVPI